jgi:hypothetical protein
MSGLEALSFIFLPVAAVFLSWNDNCGGYPAYSPHDVNDDDENDDAVIRMMHTTNHYAPYYQSYSSFPYRQYASSPIPEIVYTSSSSESVVSTYENDDLNEGGPCQSREEEEQDAQRPDVSSSRLKQAWI